MVLGLLSISKHFPVVVAVAADWRDDPSLHSTDPRCHSWSVAFSAGNVPCTAHKFHPESSVDDPDFCLSCTHRLDRASCAP